ncbi:hypothetical protein KY284_032458 [Solanum tuberosum]|nr:hypothetical protein KY284_032458 [Solanum tuberosum]
MGGVCPFGDSPSVLGEAQASMVNTRFNIVSPLAPINTPTEELQREIEEDNVDVENIKDVGQEKEVQAETTDVPPLDPVLAQQIMSFLKGLVGPGVLPSVQAIQAPTNPLVVSTAPKVDRTGGNNVFFHPLLGSVMTGKEHKILTMFSKLKPLVFLGTKNKDAYEFILDYYERLHKLGIVHQYAVEFVSFQLEDLISCSVLQNYVPRTLRNLKKYATQLMTIEEERISLLIRVPNSELQVLSVHMTSTRSSFNEVTDYVKKVDGVRGSEKPTLVAKPIQSAMPASIGMGKAQPGRELALHDDRAQCYAFLGKNEAEVSDAMITVSKEEVVVDPQKIEAVKNWIRPSSVTEFRSFVGLASYYRQFVKNFSSIATHLTNLTKKEIQFEWTEKFEESFQKFNTILTTAPILALPIEGKDFIVYCDVSHFGLGDVLMHDKNVIAYASRQLKMHERNYPTHDLEFAAVVFALKIWRHYLYVVKCEEFSDRRSLKHVFTQKDMNLRQQKWMELLKDYDVTIQYYPGKANMVANALSRTAVSMGSLACLNIAKRPFAKEIHTLESKFMQLGNSERGGELRRKTVNGKAQKTTLDADGVLNFKGRICVLRVDDLIKKLLGMSHGLRYSIHPGVTKMYQDLIYWWSGIKKHIAKFEAKCPNYQQVKYEHQRPAGLLQTMSIPKWKWERIAMDFVVGLPMTLGKFDSIWIVVDRLTKSAHFILIDGQSERTMQVLEDMLRGCVLDFGGNWDKFIPLCEFSYNNSYHSSIDMAPFEALHGKGCRSPIGWFKARDVKPLGVDLMKYAQDKVRSIQANLLAAQSRQKKYADHKVSPMKGVMRFCKKGKLSPQYIGPFEVIECVGPVAYRLALPPNLSVVHPHRPVEEATWETKRDMRDKYPQLFIPIVRRFRFHRYRESNGKNWGPKNFFVVFGFSQPSLDLDEIKVFQFVQAALMGVSAALAGLMKWDEGRCGRTSGTNPEREGSSFLGFQACFEVGDGCDSMIV